VGRAPHLNVGLELPTAVAHILAGVEHARDTSNRPGVSGLNRRKVLWRLRTSTTCVPHALAKASAERDGAGRELRLVIAVDGKTVRVRHEVACSEWITVEEVPVVVT
jgi:hypothetical protein